MTKILNIPPKEIEDANNNINVKGTAIYSKDETNRYSLEVDILL